MAFQRSLFEPVQGLGQVARGALAVVIELAEFVLRLRITPLCGLLAGGNGFGEVFRQAVQVAAASGRDQQGVAAGIGQQRKEKQQAAQGQGAAGAVHESHSASEAVRASCPAGEKRADRHIMK
ncbi:hypothetical protein D3C76_1216850 [compost metagenome]